METYFTNPSGSNNGGMFCENERTGQKMQKAFRKIDAIHNHSFKVTGGNYTKQKYERTCAIRLARTLFFQVGQDDMIVGGMMDVPYRKVWLQNMCDMSPS